MQFPPADMTPHHYPMLGVGTGIKLKDYAHFSYLIVHNGRRFLSSYAIGPMKADHVGTAWVPDGEYVEIVIGIRPPSRSAANRIFSDIYRLGKWQEEMYPEARAFYSAVPAELETIRGLDKTRYVYAFFQAGVTGFRNGFNPFYPKPVIPLMIRKSPESGRRHLVRNDNNESKHNSLS